MKRYSWLLTWAIYVLVCLAIGVALASAAEVSICDFGAIPNDNQDDTAAIQAAVRDGGTVRVPAGVYNLAVSGKTPAVTCPKSVRLVGEGRDRSILRTETELTASGHVLFFAAGTQAAVERLAIEGPEKCGEFYCRLLWSFAGPGAVLRIDQAKLRGGTHGVLIEERGGAADSPRLTILDSLIQSPTGLHMAAASGYCDVVRCEFSNYGQPAGSKPDRYEDHAIYTYLPVNLHVSRSTFAGNTSNGWDIGPHGGTGRGRVVIEDSIFRGNGTRGIFTHVNTYTVIRGCQLGTVQVEVARGGALLEGCSLASPAQVKPPASSPSIGSWTFRDCRFGE